MGPGLSAPLVKAASAHPGPLAVYEWREDALASLEHAVAVQGLAKRCAIHSLDLDLFTAPVDSWDGVWSLDEFTYAPNPSRLAVQLMRGLKPGAAVAAEFYASAKKQDFGPAFASAFAEQQTPGETVIPEVLAAAGMSVEQAEETTEAHIKQGRAGFVRLQSALSSAGRGGLDPLALREIAWEAESWRTRLHALGSGTLKRWRILARRPAKAS
jgi:hypothetical protein